MPEFVRKCPVVYEAEKVVAVAWGFGSILYSCSWFLIDNNVHVNNSLHNVGVYKMAVNMCSDVRCVKKIWNGECEILRLVGSSLTIMFLRFGGST